MHFINAVRVDGGIVTAGGATLLLIIVRQGASDFYEFLRETFAGEPVYLLWDRRVRDRRQRCTRRLLDERRGERRVQASSITLRNLPFIAVRT